MVESMVNDEDDYIKGPPANHIIQTMNLRTSFLPLLAALTFASPAQAATKGEISDLADAIEATGTEIVLTNCKEKAQGHYFFDPNSKVDRLTICKNHVDMADHDEVWEVLAHESTHVMQACMGGLVFSESDLPRTFRELQSKAPHYAKLLDNDYRGDHVAVEAEAFWMELQPPAHVIGYVKEACKPRN